MSQPVSTSQPPQVLPTRRRMGDSASEPSQGSAPLPPLCTHRHASRALLANRAGPCAGHTRRQEGRTPLVTLRASLGL